MAHDITKGFSKKAKTAMKDFGFTGSLNDPPPAQRDGALIKPRGRPTVNDPPKDARYVRTTLADLPGAQQIYGVQPSKGRRNAPKSEGGSNG